MAAYFSGFLEAMPSGGFAGLLCVSQIGDERFATLGVFHPRIHHPVSTHELLGVGQITI